MKWAQVIVRSRIIPNELYRWPFDEEWTGTYETIRQFMLKFDLTLLDMSSDDVNRIHIRVYTSGVDTSEHIRDLLEEQQLEEEDRA